MKVHYSSKTIYWETPQDLFDELDLEFRFNIDVCANEENAKLPKYFNEKMDGLSQSWAMLTCWMNPPYGRVIQHWVKKAYDSQRQGTTTVALLPSRTDTRWFHNHIYNQPNVEIRFIKGRLKFGKATDNAPFPNMIVIFRPVMPL